MHHKKFGIGTVITSGWAVVVWILNDIGFIQIGSEAIHRRDSIVSWLWWLLWQSWFSAAIALGCLGTYAILELRVRRTIPPRLPAVPSTGAAKGFLDYKIEARQAFEDVTAQLLRYVDVHNEWTAILASGVETNQKLDEKGPFFTDKKRDIKAKELTAQTAKKLDKVTERLEEYVAELAPAVERLAANQVEYFRFVFEHDLERESLAGMRTQFIGFQGCYRIVRDRQISWRKTIHDYPAPTSELIQSGERYVAVLTRSIAAYTQLDEHVGRMIELLDQKLSAVAEGNPPAPTKSPIPNLQELFLADFSTTLRMHRPVEIHWKSSDGMEGDATVTVQTHLDFEAGSRFVGFFVAAQPHAFDVILGLASGWAALSTVGMEGLDVLGGHVGQLQQHSGADLKASGRVFVYHEGHLSAHQIAAIEDAFTATGGSVVLRGMDYGFSRRS